jgi:ATP-binding cassette subfamily B protein
LSANSSLRSTLSRSLHLGRALRLVWEAAPGWTALNLVLLVLQGLLPLAALFLLREIIDAVEFAASEYTATSDLIASFQGVLVWLALAAGLGVLTALLRSLSEVTTQTQSMLVTDHVSDVLHAQSILVDLEYYENPGYHDTMHRAQAEAPYRPTSIVNHLVQFGQNGVRLAGLVGLFLSLSPLLGLVVLFAALPGAFVRVYYSRKRYSFEEQQARNERRAWYYHWMLTDSGHAKEVRLFDYGTAIIERFQALREALRAGRLQLVRGRAAVDFLVQSLAALAIFAALGLAAYQVVQGSISIGDLMAIYMGFQMGLSAVQAILGSLAGLYEDNLFLTHFYQFLNLQPRVTAPVSPRQVPERIQRGILFKGVSFSYPNHDPVVLQGVDLSLAPGQVIALVGANGSGKTTIIKLLCQLYHPTSGSITLDGQDLRNFNPLEWRRMVSVVFQDYIHYYLTAQENIWLGDVHRKLDNEAIRDAAQRSGADAFIRSLPAAYDTHLGTWFSDGKELSGGEWQKVALARAFYRQTQVLILDEPTSSLDPLAEEELFTRFRGSIGERSAILISHRFSTVRMADVIYVLDRGQVIEKGSHAELLDHDGYYARFYHAQADHYQPDGPAI